MNNAASCPVCDSKRTFVFLTRKQLPVHQNIVIDTAERAVATRRGDLELVVCEDCGFVFNQAFDLAAMHYEESYDNSQTYSPYFNDYVDGLVQGMVEQHALQQAAIVEVGCGKGVFLKKLVEAGAGNSGYGFDPSYEGPLTDLDGRVRFERRFYDETCTDIPADVVVCRHVIEHVPDPLSLLRSIRMALAHADRPRVFFETPCIEWILRNQVFFDVFYEHCSYFSKASLTTLFQRAGFRVERVKRVFEGQYLWLEATLQEEEPVVKEPGVVPELARQFATAEQSWIATWKNRLTQMATGPVAIWGAGAKGVTFLNLIDPKKQVVDCVIDLNLQKQGRFLSGTGHPILSYKEIPARGLTAAVLMNPNYEQEIRDLLLAEGISIELTL